MRSASGLYRYAQRTGNKNLQSKARMTKELALAAPMKEGLFPSVIRTDTYNVEIDGEKYRRNKPWSEAWWTNSNRRPWDYKIGSDWYHILDSSWTCFLMLRWYDELEKDPRLLDYCVAYADKLISLQDDRRLLSRLASP